MNNLQVYILGGLGKYDVSYISKEGDGWYLDYDKYNLLSCDKKVEYDMVMHYVTHSNIIKARRKAKNIIGRYFLFNMVWRGGIYMFEIQ